MDEVGPKEQGELTQGNIAGARDYFSRALAALEAIQATSEAARTRGALESLAWRIGAGRGIS